MAFQRRTASPGARGGGPADAFHVVVLLLPGYGSSPAPAAPGVNSRRVAELRRGLMAGLDHPRRRPVPARADDTAALGTAEGTVELHVTYRYDELGVSSRTEALAAVGRGLVRLP